MSKASSDSAQTAENNSADIKTSNPVGHQVDELQNGNLLSPATVIAWLQERREFFYDNPQILDIMRLPHRAGSKASSLIERQVERLRDNMAKQDQQMQDFLQIANENEQLSQRIHDLAVAVLAANTTEIATTILVAGLREDFNAEAVSVVLRTAPQQPFNDVLQFSADDVFWQTHDEWLEAGKPSVGRPTALCDTVFVDQTIASAVCVPLKNAHQDKACGLLAIGSPNADRFPPGTRTDLLQNLAELLATKFSTLLA